MGFYYFSVFSIFPLSIVYGLLLLAYWGLKRVTQGMPGKKALLAIVGALFLVLPISEELWIAWNFGQACKTAGTTIHKKVQVEGFYDDTRTTQIGPLTDEAIESFENTGYRFLEMKARERFVRIEKSNGKWNYIALDHPTARYWYGRDKGNVVAHKVSIQKSTVTDKQVSADVAVYRLVSREAPWFFISLGRPNQGCDSPGGGPHSKGTFLIYREVLLPIGIASGVTK